MLFNHYGIDTTENNNVKFNVDTSIISTTKQTVFDNIRQWGDDKGITNPERRPMQLMKMTEEVGELAGGIAKGNEEVVKDSIGVYVVVLTLLAKQSGFTIEECVEHAYQTIKNRTGKTVNGVFVKD